MVTHGASDNIIRNNVISGNGFSGIVIRMAGSDNNTVVGNFIGVGPDGTTAAPNGTSGAATTASHGIEIHTSTANNQIGGTTSLEANIIANNTSDGIRVEANAGTGNSFLRNEIYNNGGLGIDLGGDGITLNDGALTGGQPNLLIDFPVFTSVQLSGTTLTVGGYVGAAPGDTDFANVRVELFRSSNEGTHGEGRAYLGFLITDANGNFTGALTVAGLTGTDLITATTTDGSGNTSEFGPNADVNAPPVNTVPGAQTVNEDAALALSGISVNDVDGNLSTVQLSVLNGILTVSLAGGATISAGANGTNTLTLSGTQVQINAALATLVYQGTLNYNGADTLTVLSTDATSLTDSDTVAITVTAVNDAPVVAANTGSTVARGGTDVITNVELQITDVDNTPGQLTFNVTLGPVNGQLELTTAPGFSINSFTQAQIDAGQIVYVHNGSFTTSDGFTFTVSDGAGGNIGATTFGITVTSVNSVPTLAVNAGSTVTQGLADVITLGELQVTDVDNSPGQLIYTVTTAPINGRLELTTAPGMAITTFTQADIDTGRLVFIHSGAAATSDSFTFTVSDRAGGTIGATTFSFTVAPFIPPPGGGGGSGGGSTGGSGGSGSGSGSGGTGSGTGSSGGVVQPPAQPPSVLISTEAPVRDVSVVGATKDPLPRVVIGNRAIARIEQLDPVIQEPPILLSEPFSLPVKKALSVGHQLVERLTRLADDLERGVQEREHQTHLIGRVASFSGMALSAGFVAWILRGGSLLSSFLVSMPAWRHFDPLPVLGGELLTRRKRDRKIREEDEQENKQFRGLDRVLKSSNRQNGKNRRA